MSTHNISLKKRLDLELSLYLVVCLALFLVAAILGSAALAQKDYAKLPVVNVQNNEALPFIDEELETSFIPVYRNVIVMNAADFRDRLQLFAQVHTSYSSNLLIFIAVLFTVFVLILFLFTSGWVQSRLFGPISELINMSAHDNALFYLASLKTKSVDIEILRNLFINLVSDRAEKEKQEKQLSILEKQAAIANIAAQVAHDIRLPLAALAVLEHELTMLAENKRILVRSAINRIRDISNNLLDKKRDVIQQDNLDDTIIEPRSPQLIFALLEQLITEKRTQYRSKLNIEINDRFDSKSYGLFAHVQPIEFKRIISNLINNAVEALPDGGHVALELSSVETNIQIIVTDNGKGIPEKILPRLMQAGVTHDKVNGSGLGLYHARNTIESWGGKIDIVSTIGKGTSVTVTLPRVAAPKWFVEKILIRSHMKLAIIDDDASIHQIWQSRLAPICKMVDLQILHFSTPSDFQNFMQNEFPSDKNITCLIDYEFLDHNENGLDIIEKNNLAAMSILVTSRFEEPQIRARSENLSIKLIPKGLAGFVPFELGNQKKTYDAVLLDDDFLIRTTWEHSAEEAGKHLLVFEDIEGLNRHLNHIEFDTPLYIDSNLKSEMRGEALIRELFKIGYQNLYLATGYERSHFGNIPEAKAIVGKMPPWVQ